LKAVLTTLAALSFIALAACSSNNGGGGNNGVLGGGGPGGGGAPGGGVATVAETQKVVAGLVAHAWCLDENDPQNPQNWYQDRYVFAANGTVKISIFSVVNQRRGEDLKDLDGTFSLQGAVITTTVNGKSQKATLSNHKVDAQTGEETVDAVTDQGAVHWYSCN
jgi:hypothetical protein